MEKESPGNAVSTGSGALGLVAATRLLLELLSHGAERDRHLV